MSACSTGVYAPEKKDVLAAAEGRWLHLYQLLAPELVDAQTQPGVARNCPVHGGKDGFRVFRKTAGTSGGGVCQTCGIKPDGLALLMWVRDWGFHEVLQEVGSLLGVKDPHGRYGNAQPPKEVVLRQPVVTSTPSDSWLREALRKVWSESVPVTHPAAEPARLYLRSRGILAWDRPGLARSVRFHPCLTHRGQDRARTRHPAIVALISDAEGRAVTIQRIYLTAKGEKAPLESPKKMFPIPSDRSLPGGGIRTSQPGEVVDVCEGLETALAVETATGLPVWALVNAYLLEHFMPPPAVTAVRIWADKDRKEGGQKAALALKKRLWDMGIKAQILLPWLPIPDGAKGVDWNDVLLERGPFGFSKHQAEVYRAVR
ncbi:Uncharacterized domain associated with phage/plasmid primase [Azotobacter beijerinckii]|uniref:Uncharacterized domain associated with phage/plasmid primase n=1 Tax=Azotobacter beijerinckii TaxID=170623 RepID=A0A1H9N3H6_9GAMM|nr:toprim domain-containing protein [Azotobacter beijerinckii]SER30428.1 Uncharacterized domain associated with phage/plasmid primase [Azotobacter beijerinckii]